ncbi:MAG: sigma-70 family RNA polymerase sigma factor [Nocardioidaceae bacterium]
MGSDAALAARLAAGDDHALAEIFDDLAGAVHHAARRILGQESLAHDVVQDVFVRLWTHPERFDAAAGSLATYLAMLARSRALDLLRSELRRTARQERQFRLDPTRLAGSVADEVATADAARLVRRAIAELPHEQRRVVELAYFEGMTYREVAAAEGIPEGTAKSRIRLAHAKLASLLDRDLLEQP